MQSINAGFQSLHDLVKPRHGEKLSKVRMFLLIKLLYRRPRRFRNHAVVVYMARRWLTPAL